MNPEKHDPMERQLWARMRQLQPSKAGPCPDSLLLASYVDGSATGAEKERVEAHLSSCPACLKAVAETRRLLASEPMMVPTHVAARAKALVAARPSVRLAAGAQWMSVARWAAAAAAAVAIGYTGFRAGDATYWVRNAQTEALVREASFGLADASSQPLFDDDIVLALAEGEK